VFIITARRIQTLHFDRNIGVCALFTLAISTLAQAGPVSATPGTFTGTIVFNAPVQPDAMTIDARDATNTFTAHADATQGGALCPSGSNTWCYSIVVESALASSYLLRPIASVAKSTPYVTNRIPFPPQGPFAISASATVNVPPIVYQPGQVSGALSAADMNHVPLQLKSLYFSAMDNSNTFPEACGGSLEFCPFNSVFNAAIQPPPGPGNFQLFLKPAADYKFLSQSFTLDEGLLAQSVVGWNFSQHIGTVNAGQNLVQNHPFNEVAEISGTISLGQPVYNIEVDVNGYTTTFDPVQNAQLGFVDDYVTQNFFSHQPLANTNYVSRIFDFADFSKPFGLRPQFTLSDDGQTILQYPPQTINLQPGDHKVLDFTGTSAKINGNIIFSPAYSVSGIYPGIQAEAFAGGAYNVAQASLQPNAQGAAYAMTVFGASWDYWRWGWNFNLGNSNFTSLYTVGQFLNIAVPVANGATVQKDWLFDTAMLKTFFTAPAGTTISAPMLDAISGTMVNGNFVPDATETAHAEGLNQNLVHTGEVRMVLRVRSNGAFKVTPSAIINTNPNVPSTGRTDFSPFIIAPQKGDVTVVGVPGNLSLTVTSPQEGQSLSSCTIPVSGYATGTQNITITVNGQAVATHPGNNPNDPNLVTFSTTVAGNGANTTITVVASSPTNSPVTDVIHVSATSSTPPTVTAKVGTAILWPPNHDLVNVGLTAGVNSACDASPSLAITVYSNESDTVDTGSGNFSPDAKDVAASTLRLRSERQGSGNGRVYLIMGTGADHSSNTGFGCATVVVPQDQSAASVSQLNAMAAAAAASCKNGQMPAGYVQVGVGPVIGPKQ
jgi:hypothetical protein